MWWFILVPFIWIIAYKLIWYNRIEWTHALVHFASVIATTLIFVGFFYFFAVSDTEIHNGYITKKVRDHDSHQESYSCNCSTDSKGNTSCQTCYRTVYTVDWYLKTTIGNIHIDSDESYYPTVYLTPNPNIYANAVIGEMCSTENRFVNYVQAAKNSLFNTEKYKIQVKESLPVYPELYGIYKIKTVLNVNTKVDVSEYQKLLNEKQKVLGNSKQVNIIVVFVNTVNKNYKYALEKHWIGGKKNDLVVIIGTTDSKTIEWADGFTFGLSAGNKLLLTEITDSLIRRELNAEYVINTITSHTEKSFKRKPMQDFKYLAKEIEPSKWQMIFLFIFQLALNIGVTFCVFNSTNHYRRY